MKKIINVKLVNELELKFEDGKSLTLKFDVQALSHILDFKGGLEEFIKDPSTPEVCAKLLYIGAVSNNVEFTVEEARKVVSNLDPATITTIINEFNESMGAGTNEVNKELQKKMMALFLNSKK
jgi:hypothetical protein